MCLRKRSFSLRIAHFREVCNRKAIYEIIFRRAPVYAAFLCRIFIDFSLYIIYNIIIYNSAKKLRNNALMLNRRSSREAVLGLIFENEFGLYDDKTELYKNAVAARGIEENEYIRTLYFGILEKRDELDAYIEKYAKGRTLARISKIAKAVMRISIYEMLYIDDIPASVSINEAVELAKQYDDDKTKAFVNGILNAVKEELGK